MSHVWLCDVWEKDKVFCIARTAGSARVLRDLRGCNEVLCDRYQIPANELKWWYPAECSSHNSAEIRQRASQCTPPPTQVTGEEKSLENYSVVCFGTGSNLIVKDEITSDGKRINDCNGRLPWRFMMLVLERLTWLLNGSCSFSHLDSHLDRLSFSGGSSIEGNAEVSDWPSWRMLQFQNLCFWAGYLGKTLG